MHDSGGEFFERRESLIANKEVALRKIQILFVSFLLAVILVLRVRISPLQVINAFDL